MEGNLEKLLKSTITINSIGNRSISLNKPNIKKVIQTLKNFHPINTFYKNILIDPKLEYKPRRKYNST